MERFTEVIFAPFLGWFNGEGNGKFMYFGSGDEKLDMTTMKDTAEFTAEVAVDESASGYLNGECIASVFCLVYR